MVSPYPGDLQASKRTGKSGTSRAEPGAEATAPRGPSYGGLAALSLEPPSLLLPARTGAWMACWSGAWPRPQHPGGCTALRALSLPARRDARSRRVAAILPRPSTCDALRRPPPPGGRTPAATLGAAAAPIRGVLGRARAGGMLPGAAQTPRPRVLAVADGPAECACGDGAASRTCQENREPQRPHRLPGGPPLDRAARRGGERWLPRAGGDRGVRGWLLGENPEPTIRSSSRSRRPPRTR